MPRQAKGKKKFIPRRRFAKKRVYSAQPIFPLKDKTIMKHRYVIYDSIDPGAGTADYITLKLNSMYDPTTNAGDHQPMYFDEMCALYKNYVVIGTKVTVSAFASTYVGNTYLVVRKDIDSSPFSSILTEMEQQRHGTRYKPLKHDNTLTTISTTWSAKKDLGVDPVVVEDYWGNSTADVSKIKYLHVLVGSPDPNVNQTAVNVTITIDYIARWFHPEDMTAS